MKRSKNLNSLMLANIHVHVHVCMIRYSGYRLLFCTVYSINVSFVGPPLDGIHAAVGGQRSTEQPRPRVDGDSNLPKEVGDQSSDYELHP